MGDMITAEELAWKLKEAGVDIRDAAYIISCYAQGKGKMASVYLDKLEEVYRSPHGWPFEASELLALWLSLYEVFTEYSKKMEQRYNQMVNLERRMYRLETMVKRHGK